MKSIIFSLTVLTSAWALAEVPSYNCGYGDIATLAKYDGTSSQLKVKNLSEAESAYMEVAFDDAWNCDEGVELLGADFDYAKGKKVVYKALCSKDSLGTHTVSLTLACKETYLN